MNLKISYFFKYFFAEYIPLTDCPFFIHIKVGLCVIDESCFQNAKEQDLKK